MEDNAAMLQGLRVLVVEDEVMITLMMEDMLGDLGCTIVGPAANVAEGLALIARETVDVGLLDLNLSLGETGYPVADALAARGVPFAFVTGYGASALREPHRGRATLGKPFRFETLEQLLKDLSRAMVR